MSEPVSDSLEIAAIERQREPHETGVRFKGHKPLNPARKLWFKQKGESLEAYEAFTTYLMMPMEERSLQKTADHLHKSFNLMARWSSVWSWQIRVGAYEEHYLLLQLDSIQAARDRMFVEQQQVAEQGMDLVRDAMSEMAAVRDADGKMVRGPGIKGDAMVRLFDISAKIQRMAITGRAESAEKIAAEHESLVERWSEELVILLEGFMDALELTPAQYDQGKVAIASIMGVQQVVLG